MTTPPSSAPGPVSQAGAVTGFEPASGLGSQPDVSELVAAAVLAVPGVAELHGGAFGQVASYLPGRSVTGVRVREDVTDVHVILFWGVPVLATADLIRTAIQPLTAGISARIDVTIDDIVGQDTTAGATRRTASSPAAPAPDDFAPNAVARPAPAAAPAARAGALDE